MTGDEQGLDRDLRERFAALRRREEADAPAFADSGFTAGRASGREPVRVRLQVALAGAAACLLTVAGAGLWMRTGWHSPRAGRDKPVVSVLEWKSPTDFLLETPGRELLRTVPRIGALENGLGAPAHPARRLRRDD